MDQEKIGKFIRDNRKKNNLTQAALATKLGVTYQAVSKWENGKNIPDIVIIKQLGEIFKVDINDILDGDSSKKVSDVRKKRLNLILLGSVLVIGLVCLMVLIVGSQRDFEFKKITSNCSDFDVIGSMAYNADFSSMYISDIDYCGEDIETLYSEIECVLYEVYNNIYTEIAKCSFSDGEMTLREYLDKVQFNVDNYSTSCKKFKNSSLILEIRAKDMDNRVVSYKVPITLEDNCG